MSGFKSGTAARLLVQVSSKSEAAVDRHCPRCKARRRFVSSGKFRVNAQKKRIDAWLIFRCSICDDRWNWPVHERRPVGALDPKELDALMRNDPDLAARHAQAATGIAAGAADDPSIGLVIPEPATAETQTIEIVIAGVGARLRLDRLLARTLTLGRREIEALEAAGAIAVSPPMREALRRAAVSGQQITIDLAGCPQETSERLRQSCAVQPPDLYCETLSPR
jgi:hypothetical protein